MNMDDMEEQSAFATFDAIQDEDDRVRAINERRTEWWMADLDYLPVHHFRKRMRKVCYELSTYPTPKRLTEILQEIQTTFTTDVEQEIQQEHEFYYGRGLIDWRHYDNRLVLGGYLSDYKLCLTKLLSILIRGRKELDHQALWSTIQFIYTKCFHRPSDWQEDELQRIRDIMQHLRKTRGESWQTCE